MAQRYRMPPRMQETWVRSLGEEDPLEKERQPNPVSLPGKPLGQRSLVAPSKSCDLDQCTNGGNNSTYYTDFF